MIRVHPRYSNLHLAYFTTTINHTYSRVDTHRLTTRTHHSGQHKNKRTTLFVHILVHKCTAVKRTVTHTTPLHTRPPQHPRHTTRAHKPPQQQQRQRQERHRRYNRSYSNQEHDDAGNRTRANIKPLRCTRTTHTHTTHRTCLTSLQQRHNHNNTRPTATHMSHTPHTNASTHSTGRPHYANACLNKATSSYEGRHTRHEAINKMRRNFKNAAGLQQQSFPNLILGDKYVPTHTQHRER